MFYERIRRGVIRAGGDQNGKLNKQKEQHETQNMLLKESKILHLLSKAEGFPRLHWYGTEGDYNVMVY